MVATVGAEAMVGGTSGANAPGGARATNDASRGAAEAERLDEAARSFERLMLQRMLADMRRAGRTEEPSNAMANWESMFDERVATLVAERGGLGVADALRRSLGGGAEAASGTAPDATATHLAMPDRRALRALPPDSPAVESHPGPGASVSANDPIATPARPSGAIGLGALGAPLPALAGANITPGRADTHDDGPAAGRTAFLSPLREHAERAARRLGTHADAVLAIAALETGWGRHRIVDETGRDSHNLFGIKAHGAAPDDPDAVRHRTTEFVGGTPRKLEALFRRFDSPADAVDGFADFVLDNPRYRPALAVAADSERFLRALHGAGYATDPRYADKAIEVLGSVRAHLDARSARAIPAAAATPTTPEPTP